MSSGSCTCQCFFEYSAPERSSTMLSNSCNALAQERRYTLSSRTTSLDWKVTMLQAEDLLGRWRSDATDSDGIRIMGLATLEFRPDGTLIYTSHGEDKDEIIFLN